MLTQFDLLTSGGHLMMLYQNDRTRDFAISSCINHGLERGNTVVIYASIHAENAAHLSRLLQSSSVKHSKKHLQKGNLRIVSLKLCYERALAGDLSPIREIKAFVEKIVEPEKANHMRNPRNDIIIVADCADNLSMNEKFVECIAVERWWDKTCQEWEDAGLNISVICPHLHWVLTHDERDRIAAVHKSALILQ